jgi:hypothetical protein
VDRFGVHVRRELVFLALGTMEACVIAPLATALVSGITSFRPSSLSVTGLFLGALLAVHYLARAGLRLPLHPLLRAALLGAGMLASGLLIVHQLFYAQTSLWDPAWLVSVFHGLQAQEMLSPDLVVFLLAVFVWWRGVVLAQRRLDSDTVVSRFHSGLVMLAVTTVVSGFLSPAPPYQFVFAFFFVSLLAIALARAEEVGRQYGGSQSPFGLGWLAMLVTASLGVLLLAAGVATLLTGENLSHFLGPVWEAQWLVFILLARVLVFATSWIWDCIIEFLELVLGQTDLLRGIRRELTPPGAALAGEPAASLLTPEQLGLARAVGIVLGVLFLLLLIARSLRQLRARAGRRRDEDRESVWAEIDVRRSLDGLLEDGRRRLGEMADTLRRSRPGQVFAALTIRRVYAHMSALAAELGHPRALCQTPYEYQPTLEQAFPDCCEEVAWVTEAYVAVHYGEVPDRLMDLDMIRAAWKRIREAAVEGLGSPSRAPGTSRVD